VGSHAPCALSGPFWEQGEKGKENQQDAIFLKKNSLFFHPYIGISENIDWVVNDYCCVVGLKSC
jgi:hypothetical protein